jgi:cell division septation protein DedD
MKVVTEKAEQAISGQFEIIAGCFSSEENALNQVAKLKAKNFEARIIGKGNNGLIRVSAGVAANYEEAGNLILDLGKVGESAWPLAIK